MLPIDFENLEGMLDEASYDRLWKHEESRISEISKALEGAEMFSESIDMDKLSIDFDNLAKELCLGDTFEELMDFDSNKKEDAAVMQVVKAVRNYSGHYNVYFSRHILSNENDYKRSKKRYCSKLYSFP